MRIRGEDLQRLCQLSSELMYVASAEQRLLGTNAEIERLLGFAHAELSGEPVADFIHPEDLAFTRDSIRRAPAGERFHLENRWRTRGGGWRSISWTLLNEGNRVYGIGSDITEERAAEQALEPAAVELKLMTDNLPALISYVDTHGRYAQVNETYARWLGMRAEDMLGRRVEDVLAAHIGTKYWDQVRPNLERALAGHVGRVEAEGDYSGGQRYVEIHHRPDFDPGGRVRGVIVLVLDITKRKLSEIDLTFRAELLDNALEPIFAWKLGGEIIYWNPTAAGVYGYSREEALGRRSHDLLSTQLPCPAAEFDERLRRAGEWRGELAHTTKDGRRLVVDSRHRVILLGGRSIVIESNRDITAQRAAEAELRASESRFRSLAENAPVGIFRASRNGQATWANPRTLEIWRMTEAEFLGRGWITRVHPDDLSELAAQIRISDSSVAPNRLRYRLLLPSGEARFVEAVMTPAPEAEGSALIGVIQDVTERIRRDEQLRESEEKYRYTVELSGQIAWTADPKGGVEEFSRLGYELTGTTPCESLGTGWYQLIHAEDREITRAAWKEAIESDSTFEVEHRLRLRGGAYRWMRSRGYARRDGRGAIVRWYGTTEDIDDRKRSELTIAELNRELEKRVEVRTRELAEINRELEAFSYSVSHDLRAPLRAIDGFGRMLSDDPGTRLSDSGVRCVQRIRANTQRMGELIDDLLELSRLGRQPIDPRAVDLSAMAGGIVDELRRSDSARNVEATIEPGMVARGDPRLLRIALENLLGNAWKYTGRNPNGRIEFARSAEGSAWMIRDNGAGFDPAYAHQLFAPFQRLHREDEFPGTGIGLATVARIVHRHGGRVWAEAERGAGATFYFTLGNEGAVTAA